MEMTSERVNAASVLGRRASLDLQRDLLRACSRIERKMPAAPEGAAGIHFS
jgi:hypothetical protein